MDTTMSATGTALEGKESQDLLIRNLRVGSRTWAASQAFFFIAFLFAFFYLRALNSNGLWRGWPHTHKPHPSLAFGVAILTSLLVNDSAAYELAAGIAVVGAIARFAPAPAPARARSRVVARVLSRVRPEPEPAPVPAEAPPG